MFIGHILVCLDDYTPKFAPIITLGICTYKKDFWIDNKQNYSNLTNARKIFPYIWSQETDIRQYRVKASYLLLRWIWDGHLSDLLVEDGVCKKLDYVYKFLNRETCCVLKLFYNLYHQRNLSYVVFVVVVQSFAYQHVAAGQYFGVNT